MLNEIMLTLYFVRLNLSSIYFENPINENFKKQ